MSLRVKLLIYILCFSVGLFLLLWIFQTMFLDMFYENAKRTQIKNIAETVKLNINDEDNLYSIMQTQSMNNDACILVADIKGNALRTDNFGCNILEDIVSDQLTFFEYFNKAIENNGSFTDKVRSKASLNVPGIGKVTRLQSEGNYDLISVNFIKKVDGEFAIILISTKMTPVNATVSTLQSQLVYIGMILVGMAIILSALMTSKIVKPLEKISEGAKALALGNYDVTFKASGFREINELNDTMNYASNKLKEVDQLRRDLIANVSHDLRTPLTMIGGYGELMRDIPNENTAENAQVIVDECNRLTRLVNDLLDLSKLQEHKITLNEEVFNITSLLNKTLLRYQKTLPDNLTLELVVNEDVEVVGDEARIQQVLDNFINNAIHYGSQGEKIVLRQICKDKFVRIEVQDFGQGIDPKQLDYVWDRYYKIDKQHVRSETGSGIGLSIAKEILLLHQVEYGVISQINEGSTFYFELKRKID